MNDELSLRAQKVQGALADLGFAFRVVELPDSTRTAREAAQAVGCRVEQIVKSLVFKGMNTGQPVLVLVSGANRANEKKLKSLVGEPIEKADADFVRQRTGFSIGGVPPVGHSERMLTFIDEDLLMHEEVWAAAGTPHAVFKCLPADLSTMTDGKVINVK